MLATATPQDISDAPALHHVRCVMTTFGYRPVTEADIAQGVEVFLIDAQRFASSRLLTRVRYMDGCTCITLDSGLIPSRMFDGKIALYRCVESRQHGEERYVTLDELLSDGYVPETDPQVIDELNRAML